jgi:hypothetical protein
MKGIMLSEEEALEANYLYEKINDLIKNDLIKKGSDDLNTAVFAVALTNCLSDLIAQLSRLHGKDTESLLNNVMEDIKRQIGDKKKHIEKIISTAQ